MSKKLVSCLSAANSLGLSPRKNLGNSGLNCFARHGRLDEVRGLLRLGYSQADVARIILATGGAGGLSRATLQVYVGHVANA